MLHCRHINTRNAKGLRLHGLLRGLSCRVVLRGCLPRHPSFVFRGAHERTAPNWRPHRLHGPRECQRTLPTRMEVCMTSNTRLLRIPTSKPTQHDGITAKRYVHRGVPLHSQTQQTTSQSHTALRCWMHTCFVALILEPNCKILRRTEHRRPRWCSRRVVLGPPLRAAPYFYVDDAEAIYTSQVVERRRKMC